MEEYGVTWGLKVTTCTFVPKAKKVALIFEFCLGIYYICGLEKEKTATT